MEEKKKLIIIDSNALVHRAYHALPPLTTKNGELVNAVYGFLLVLFRALKDFRPDFVAAAFDSAGPTFRHEKFEAYKAKRPKAPEELYSQIPKIKDILNVFGIPVFEKQGFEADDIIATIVNSAPSLEKIIISGDLDSLQLVDGATKVFGLRKGVKDTVLYDEEMVKEKYQGLRPGQLADFRGLRGDPSDNIPGVKGIGEKTAVLLLNQFGTLDGLYSEMEKGGEKARNLKPALLQKLKDNKEQAFLSRSLAYLKNDVPIGFNLEECRFGEYDREKAGQTLAGFEFHSLLDKLPGMVK